MRDKLKNEEYFITKIDIIYQVIKQYLEWIQNGEVKEDRINPIKHSIVWDYLRIINSKYSLGKNIIELKDDLIHAIDTTNESWDGFWKLNDRKGKEYNQYTLSAYDEMLWMLSLGYLLDISNEDFQKLVDVIDRDQVKDFLFEFIIRAKFPDRQLVKEESYQKYFGIPKVFEKLRQATTETDKSKAEQLVKEFITKYWYKGHKDAGWYNSHKSLHNIYYGYWSFEMAAVVKIMGLDDSSFSDCKYYPKDLVYEV
jgi:hypothetical protein